VISLSLGDGGTVDDANQPSPLQPLAGAGYRRVDSVRRSAITHNWFDLSER